MGVHGRPMNGEEMNLEIYSLEIIYTEAKTTTDTQFYPYPLCPIS